jgi:hypothetical protein
MNSQEHEKLVALIAQGITSSAENMREADIAWGRTNKIIGASGYAHQIDVGISIKGEICLVECKCWKDKVGLESILVLAGRAREIVEASPSYKVHCILRRYKGSREAPRCWPDILIRSLKL